MTSIALQEQFRAEFPSINLAELPEMPDSWVGRAWRNDEAPMAETATGFFVAIIEPSHPFLSDGASRFIVYQGGDVMLETNEWAAVLDFTGHPDDARLERLRAGTLTADDARVLLAAEDAAEKGCPDFAAYLRGVIAADLESAR